MGFAEDLLAEEKASNPAPIAQVAAQQQEDFAAQLFAEEQAVAAEVGQFDLGTERLPLGTRFSLADAETIGEKVKVFQERFPEGDLRLVNNELLFREDPSKGFSRVDPGGFLEEPLADIVEFIGGDLGAIAGEVALTVGARGTNLLPLLGRVAAGGAAGELLQQQVQTARGIQEETIGEQLSGASQTAAEGVVGTVVFGLPLNALINAGRGSGLTRIGDEGERALRAEQRLGLGDAALTPGQVTDNPVVKKLEGQAAAIIPAFQRRFADQQKALAGVLKPDLNDLRVFRAQVVSASKRMKDTLIGQMKRDIVSPERGGQAIREGIQEYARISQENIVRPAYAAARDIETPRFDLSPASVAAGDVLAGRLGTADPALGPIVQRLNNIQGPQQLPSGEILTVTDQLRNVRSELFALKTPGPNEVSVAKHAQANSIFNAVDEVLNNPTNTNREFREAWRAANGAARQRFQALDQLALLQDARDQVFPTQLMQRVARPNQSEAIELLRSTIPTERFQEVQRAFKTQLLNDADNITKTLGDFDDATIGKLISPGERTALERVGGEIDRINALGVEKIAERQSLNRAFIDEIVTNKDTRKIQTLDRILSGNERLAMRAAIMDWGMRQIVQDNKIVPGALDKVIRRITQGGLRRFLTRQDFSLFRNAKDYAQVLRQTADAGTSIQASEAIAGARGLSPSAMKTIIEHNAVARLFLSQGGRNFLVGTGKPRADSDLLKILPGILVQVGIDPNLREIEEE